MIRTEDLKHGKTVYMYREDNYLMFCDIVKIGNKWGYFREDDMSTLRTLTNKDLEKMFLTREDAEQLELF